MVLSWVLWSVLELLPCLLLSYSVTDHNPSSGRNLSTTHGTTHRCPRTTTFQKVRMMTELCRRSNLYNALTSLYPIRWFGSV